MNIKRKIFEFIVDNQVRWNYVPLRREIHKMFSGLSDDVDLHLEQLEREGLLKLTPEGGQEITISTTYRHIPEMKLLRNRLSGSKPLPETSEDGSIALDLRGMGILMEHNLYALLVHDESMIDAGVQHGDVAILRHAAPQRGDIVAVEMDGQVHLRRYILLAGIPHLLAENPFRPDIVYASDFPFRGVLWASIRIGASRLVPDHAQRKPVTYSTSRRDEQPGRSPRGNRRAVQALGHPKSSSADQAKPARHKLRARPADFNTEPPSKWPTPPSGIQLNDMAGLEYSASAQTSSENERPYGWALEQAIREYEAAEERRRRSN